MEKIFNKDLYLNYKSDFSPDDFHHVAFKTTNYEEMVESVSYTHLTLPTKA